MMRKKQAVVTLLVVLGSVAFASQTGWKVFRSSTGFSVSYPVTWVRNGVSTDRLQVRSSEGGAEGIGIKQGQAEITVMEAPESSSQTFAQVIAYYTQGATVLSQKDIQGEAVPHSCSHLREVTSKESAVPPEDSPISVPTMINTDFFCEGDGHKVVTLLRNWKGDKRQQEYQQVALQIAQGIRMTPQKTVAGAPDPCFRTWELDVSSRSCPTGGTPFNYLVASITNGGGDHPRNYSVPALTGVLFSSPLQDSSASGL